MQTLDAGNLASHAGVPQKIENLVEEGWNYVDHHKLAVATTVAGTALGLFALKKVFAEDAVEVAASAGQAGKPLLELGGELSPAELKSLGMKSTTMAGENLLAEPRAQMDPFYRGIPDRPIDTEPSMRSRYPEVTAVEAPGTQATHAIKPAQIDLSSFAPSAKNSVPVMRWDSRGVPDITAPAPPSIVIPQSWNGNYSSGGALAAFGRGLRVMSVLRLIS